MRLNSSMTKLTLNRIQKGEFSVIVGECTPVVRKIIYNTVWSSSHPFPYRPALQIDEQLMDLDLMEDSIQVFKIFKLLQRMKNK
jgi:hypothetical protein